MRRFVLPSAATFWVAASVLVLSLWASGAPAMLYPEYASRWHTGPVVTTALFAVYPVALVLVMVLGGSLSDRFGRRRLILAGTIIVALGSLLFAIAQLPAVAFGGRIFQGAGVGLAMSAASAAMVEANRGTSTRASAVNTAATALGAAAAILVGGWLVEYTVDSTHLAFWVLLGFVGALVMAVLLLPEAARSASDRSRRPLLTVPRDNRHVFVLGTVAVTVAFITGAVFLALGAQIIRDLVGTTNAFLAAATLATWPVVIVPVTLLATRLRPASAVQLGGTIAAVGFVLLLVAGTADSLALFLGAALLAGVGYGFLVYGGLGLVTSTTDTTHRASTFSTMYLTAYLAQGSTAVLVGALATTTSLATAIAVAVPVIALLCIGTTALARRRR